MAVNLHKIQHWASSKFYWFSWKAKGYWMNFKIHRISKDKKVNKLWRKLLHQITLNAKSRFVWEKEKHTNILSIFTKSNILVQTRHLCRFMSVKSSTWECLSNSLIKESCNCSERTFNIACGITLSKKNYQNSDVSLSDPTVLLYRCF